jgi:hypothetical protein
MLACAVRAKANPELSGQVVPLVRLAKIEFKKMCGGEMLVAFTNSLKKQTKRE